ncbi:hypothetical protein BDQ17DRAFT_1338567 [Cyathus striatus]|nr:hypothetical protein BDQ17DRAFT_1338567 [Cyathus striatus]
MNSTDDLKFTATVTDTGAESVKVLRHGTILDDGLPTKSFVVTKDGADAPLTGINLPISLFDIDDIAFTVIPAGESVTVNHEVASLYDFASASAGNYSFYFIFNFVVTSAAENVTSVASFSKVMAKFTIIILVQVTAHMFEPVPSQVDRTANICTDTSKKSFINASYDEVKHLVKISSSDALYKSYFGTTDTSQVTAIFDAIANESPASRILSCVDREGSCRNSVNAYTRFRNTNANQITFCSGFFNKLPTANFCHGSKASTCKDRGGTTLHELTHAVGDTKDINYGCSNTRALSDSEKIENADAFTCFATHVYQITQCFGSPGYE